MTLQYTDIFTGKIRKIRAEITTEHCASHYGIPAVVLPDGNALDAQSWVLLGYRVISLKKSELSPMQRWICNLYAMLGVGDGPVAAHALEGLISKSKSRYRYSR